MHTYTHAQVDTTVLRFHIIVSFQEIGRNRNGEAGDQFLEKVRYSVLVLKMLVFKVIMRCSAGVQDDHEVQCCVQGDHEVQCWCSR